MTTTESPAPQSAGLSAEEVARLVEEARECVWGWDQPGTYNKPLRLMGLAERLATALEATAARLAEEEAENLELFGRICAAEQQIAKNQSALAERERELGEAHARERALEEALAKLP